MSLATQRTGMKTALAGLEVKVYTHVHEALVAPAIVIQPGDPYLDDEDQPFDTYGVNWLVTLVVRPGTNERETDELDTLTEAVLALLPISKVSAPYAFTYNSTDYLAVNATVTNHLKIGG